jgi:hypothetical protein
MLNESPQVKRLRVLQETTNRANRPSTSASTIARLQPQAKGPFGRSPERVVQRVVFPNMPAMWATVHPGYGLANIRQDSALSDLYDDAAAQLPNTDFVQVPNTAPQISTTPGAAQPYRCDWDTAANLGLDNDYFAGAVIHELVHAAASQQYDRHGANADELVWANMNLPAAVGPVDPSNGLAGNQLTFLKRQIQTIRDNWNDLAAIALADRQSGSLTLTQANHVDSRIRYSLSTAFVHNDTVLGDLMYYLRAKNRANTDTYAFARRMLKEANDRRRVGFWSDPGTEVRRVDSQAWWFQLWKW